MIEYDDVFFLLKDTNLWPNGHSLKSVVASSIDEFPCETKTSIDFKERLSHLLFDCIYARVNYLFQRKLSMSIKFITWLKKKNVADKTLLNKEMFRFNVQVKITGYNLPENIKIIEIVFRIFDWPSWSIRQIHRLLIF